MAVKTMQDLFLHGLQDIYHGEKQILRALPKMAKKATAPELRQALERHREETTGQVARLEQVFKHLGKRARGEPCEGVQALIEEAAEVMEEVQDKELLDAGMIGAAQAVEHYEIARYGTLIAWARQAGLDGAVIGLLEQTLQEEKKTDQSLSEIALASVNRKAA